VLAGGTDAFLTRLTASGAGVVYSTYLGGLSEDAAQAVTVNSSSQAYVTGFTASADFPVVKPTQAESGTRDAFLSKFDATGSTLLHSAKIGGHTQATILCCGDEYGYDVALADADTAAFTGTSKSSDYPLVNPLSSAPSGVTTAILTVISMPESCTFTLSQTSRPFGAAGGRGSVPLAASAAGCDWTAAANSSWMHLDSTMGAGTTNLGMTVDSNGGPFRAGTIIIAGQTFVVTQAAYGARITPLDSDTDGLADFTVWRPSTGDWWTLESSSGYASYSRRGWGAAGDVPIGGDFDGDRRLDPTIWRPSTGEWWILLSTTQFTSYRRQGWGTPGDVPVAADYDGDGRADLAVFRPSTGEWWIMPSSAANGSYLRKGWGDGNFWPVPADYDGDRRADIAVWRPSTGLWWVLTSSSGYGEYFTQGWGSPGDTPLAADYDGDGRADFVVWRPSTGDWWILYSSTRTFERRGWGDSSFRPVPADYDGDGRADLAVWRPSTGYWWILQSSTSYMTYFSQGWGASSDIPVRSP
jgi:hypothetical protein